MNDKQIADAYLEGLTAELGAAGLLPPPERPAGFGTTIKEYAAANGYTEDVARKVLFSAVKAGILVGHPMREGSGGANPVVYCRPGEWPPG